MTRTVDKKYLALGIMLGVFLLLLIGACGIAVKEQTESDDSGVIRTFEDTVVLLNNGEVVEVFGDISVDMLPREDQAHLEKGIQFLTKDEALLAIEDYDG